MKRKIIFHETDSDIEILKNLDWVNPVEVQRETIQYIRDHEDLSIEYLVPPHFVISWDNAADALYQLGYERTKGITYQLLQWQQDFYSPGADLIRALLSTFPNEYFMPYYEQALREAQNACDDDWLCYLSHFIQTNKISKDDFTDEILFTAVNGAIRQYI